MKGIINDRPVAKRVQNVHAALGPRLLRASNSIHNFRGLSRLLYNAKYNVAKIIEWIGNIIIKRGNIIINILLLKGIKELEVYTNF